MCTYLMDYTFSDCDANETCFYRELNYPETMSFTSWEKAVESLQEENIPNVDKVWVIGGSHIYRVIYDFYFTYSSG